MDEKEKDEIKEIMKEIEREDIMSERDFIILRPWGTKETILVELRVLDGTLRRPFLSGEWTKIDLRKFLEENNYKFL